MDPDEPEMSREDFALECRRVRDAAWYVLRNAPIETETLQDRFDEFWDELVSEAMG